MKLLFLLTFLSLANAALPQQKVSPFLKKADKNVEQLYNAGVITREDIAFTTGELIYNDRPFQADGIYRLKSSGKTLGYLVLTSSKGRFEYFNYMIVYNPDVTVKKIIILNYTSPHGGEVASQKWLKQFEGYGGKPLKYGNDIDALSGATFSAGSLVEDVEAVTNYMRKKITDHSDSE